MTHKVCLFVFTTLQAELHLSILPTCTLISCCLPLSYLSAFKPRRFPCFSADPKVLPERAKQPRGSTSYWTTGHLIPLSAVHQLPFRTHLASLPFLSVLGPLFWELRSVQLPWSDRLPLLHTEAFLLSKCWEPGSTDIQTAYQNFANNHFSNGSKRSPRSWQLAAF